MMQVVNDSSSSDMLDYAYIEV